jgi:hypothetical protein
MSTRARSEQVGTRVVLRLVGHHPIDPDALVGEMSRGSDQEACAGLTSLVGMDLDVSVAGVVIDRDVQVVVAHRVAVASGADVSGTASQLPASSRPDLAEILHVDVHELAGRCERVPLTPLP